MLNSTFMSNSPFMSRFGNDKRLKALSALNGSYFETTNLPATHGESLLEEERLAKRVKKIYKEMDHIDGSLGQIIRKPFAVDDSPIKTLPSTMGRKQPSIDHAIRFNIEDGQHNIMKKTFHQGNMFSTDDAEGLGELFV